MVRVQFKRFSEPDPVPTWLDETTRAVPAGPFGDVDTGQGGITRGDIVGETSIVPLSTFAAGAEVYVESDDPADVLDDSDETTERATRIWWRAIVVER